MVRTGVVGNPTLFQTAQDDRPPQRPAAVEACFMERGDGGLEFGATAGGREVHAEDVVVDVEVGIGHPHRVVDHERRFDELVGQVRHEVQPAPEHALQALDEGVFVDAFRKFHHLHRGHMLRAPFRLVVKESGVESAQLVHVQVLLPLRTNTIPPSGRLRTMAMHEACHSPFGYFNLLIYKEVKSLPRTDPAAPIAVERPYLVSLTHKSGASACPAGAL